MKKIKVNFSYKIVFICLAFLFSISIFNSSLAESLTDRTLRVGIVDPIGPFTVSNTKAFSGISVDLWKMIANNENLRYKYVLVTNDNIDGAIQKLVRGDLDVLLGPISITADRNKLINFSYPYFLNEVGLIEPKSSTNVGRFGAILLGILKSPLFIFWLFLFIVHIHVYWLTEKKHIPDCPNRYIHGISYILWSHLLQKSSRELPHTSWGKWISLIWVAGTGILVTSILATITSKVTVALVTSPAHFKKASDLQNQLVAVVQGTNSVEEAEKYGARVVQTKDLDQAVELLAEKKVAAVVEDYILARNFLAVHSYPQLQVGSFILSNDQFSIALRKNTILLDKINNQILALEDNDLLFSVCSRYVGPEDARFCKL